MISCKEASERLSAALDTRLSMSERLGLRLHLFICKWCSRYGRQLKFLQRAAREYNVATAEPSDRPRLTTEAIFRINDRIAQAIRVHDFQPESKR
jgi:transposase-like protein